MKVKPSTRIWEKVNVAIKEERMGEVIVTFIAGMTGMLVECGACPDARHARAHLAAVLLSPEEGVVGSLKPLLHDELVRLNEGRDVD